MAKQKAIHASAKDKKIIAFSMPVTIKASEDEGDKKGPPTFEVTAYTGGALNVAGWELPVVIDLSGLQFSRSVIANLDHNSRQRVGHVTEKTKADSELKLAGVFSAATPFRDEVVNSAAEGFGWEASVEVQPSKVVEIPAGKSVKVNGQEFTGPLYVTRKGTLSGFAFVSHGADPNTSVSIAASAASHKERDMEPELKKWIEAMGFDVETLTDEQIAGLKANYEGKQAPKPTKKPKLDDLMAEKKAETERQEQITEIAGKACDARPYDIDNIKLLAEEAIENKWPVDKFRLELLEASVPPSHTVPRTRQRNQINNRVLEAAICMTGGLKEVEKQYDDQTLQLAHERFRHGIGVKELFVLAAQANGYTGSGYNVDIDVQRAAFGMLGPRSIQAAGFSTLSLPNVMSNVANKFLREGWMAVDQTPLRLAATRPVRDFKEITTVSLTGGFMFKQVGADGEIKSAEPGEIKYTNQADTYGILFAVTRKDIINDDLGALTAVPRRIGRGGMLKLNDIFWKEFLDNSAFFTAGNKNVSTGAGSALGLAGLEAAEKTFMNQTDADGNPLGAMAAILLVPPSKKATALELMTSGLVITGSDVVRPNGNIWQGRFRVESSAYMENTNYTGNSNAAWYLLADPNDIPVIEIAALNGRVEPVVETADASFNVLGVQMRGYDDVGVNLQEFRGGVRSAGA